MAEERDPLAVRASDEERHRVAETLRQAAGEGRIDIDELDERLEATYAAKTYGDLVPITADLPTSSERLPVPRPCADPPATPAVSYGSSVAVLGDCTRRGVWLVPERHTDFSLMGKCLRAAKAGAQAETPRTG